jgi:hypothetical protein
MSNTPENCKKIAGRIAYSMSYDELRQFVYDDVYAIMLKDEEVYEFNFEHYGKVKKPR